MKNILITTIAAVLLMGCGPKPPDISINEAAAQGNIEAVRQHLAAGADVNEKWKAGHYPLTLAVDSDHKEIVELLIANGADVNTNNDYLGMTVLQSAVLRSNKEIVELLINRGADVNAMGRAFLTPLDTALKASLNKEIADLLRKHGGKTSEELKGSKKVIEAAQSETTKVQGVDISIHDAAENGNIEAVNQHLAKGVDVNVKDKHGGTPLHRATLGGNKEIAELLIVNGVDVNTKSVSGKTALLVAAFNGRIEIIELLIAKGADVNAKSVSGGTALHNAAAKGHKEIVELLIARGAELNAKRDGRTSLDWSINQKQTAIADLLRKHGGKTRAELKAEGK